MHPICPTGVLNAGFVDVYFPFFYFDGLRYRGLSTQIWKEVAKSFECSSIHITKYLQYTPQKVMNETGWEFTVGGNLAAVKKSDIFVDLTLNSLTKVTIKEFRYTTDVVIDQLSLYEATNTTSEESWTPYEFFLVFSPPILVLIIISTILINLTNTANERLKSTPGLCFRYLVAMLFSISIMTLFFLHAAVFKGNMIVTTKPMLLAWDHIMASFKTGAIQYIESVQNLEDFEYEEMLGTNKPLRPSSTVAVVSELCKRKESAIAALYDTQVLYVNDEGAMPKNCHIYKITPQGNSSIVNDFMPTSFNYLLPPSTTKKTVEKINQIIMRLFSFEKIQDFWINRELKKPSQPRDSLQQQTISSAIPALSLTSLAGIFIAFIVGLAVSFIVHILEVTTFRLPQCRRVHMIIIPLM